MEEGASATIPQLKDDKRGVCYLSVIPPFMDADLLRRMLQKRFEIERVYL